MKLLVPIAIVLSLIFSGCVQTAEEKPQFCTEEYAPVCGEDGKKYSNECFARMEGAKIAYAGECKDAGQIANPASQNCERMGGVLEIKSEDGGEVGYCRFLDGQVCEEWALFRGECEIKLPKYYVSGSAEECALLKFACEEGYSPFFSDYGCGCEKDIACTKEYMPVCGEDANTYGNRCTAYAQGVNIAHEGECGEYEPNPRENPCTQEYVPVCGNDGKTYINRCFVAYSDTTINHMGECKTGSQEMREELCVSSGGNWNDCGSACRGAPEGTACTMQCVQYCECGGIAGFSCPNGYECKDYLPVGAADAMGICKLS